MSNPLVEKVFEYRRDHNWNDDTIRISLQFSHGQSATQIDEIIAEANAPKTDVPLNGHSTQQEIIVAATIEQIEENTTQPPAVAVIAAPVFVETPVDYYVETVRRLRDDSSETSARKTKLWLQSQGVMPQQARDFIQRALAEVPATSISVAESVVEPVVVATPPPADQTQVEHIAIPGAAQGTLRASALAAINLDLFVFA